MTRMGLLAAGVGASALGAAVYAAPGKAPVKDPPPIANYWMDVATTSGLGGGMGAMGGGGGRPDMGQIMQMMQGGGASVAHTLDLRLASRTKPASAAEADHFVPTGLQMGPSLPLITPVREPQSTSTVPWQQPKGRMLIYWGCGEHVSASQPTVVDFSKLAAGQAPPGVAAIAAMAHAVSGPTTAAGFGRWPNDRDRRAVPAGGSLLGAHNVKGNYSPDIGFSLGAGQDFMPGLGLREAGTLPSGASQLMWQPASMATGYALAMFGANPNGDFVMWSSSKSAAMPTLDYLAPAEVRRLVAAGSVLSPSTSQCTLPAEVAAAVPAGMVTMIGYGPEANFAELPKAPKWVAKVRYKTTASVMRGMGDMMGGMGAGEADQAQQEPQQAPVKKKKRGLGLGDLLGGAVPH